MTPVLLTALLPAGVVQILGAIVVIALLWIALKYLPPPFDSMRWVGYVVILLVVAYWVWTRTQ